jgi:hypothetical protein
MGVIPIPTAPAPTMMMSFAAATSARRFAKRSIASFLERVSNDTGLCQLLPVAITYHQQLSSFSPSYQIIKLNFTSKLLVRFRNDNRMRLYRRD